MAKYLSISMQVGRIPVKWVRISIWVCVCIWEMENDGMYECEFVCWGLNLLKRLRHIVYQVHVKSVEKKAIKIFMASIHTCIHMYVHFCVNLKFIKPFKMLIFSIKSLRTIIKDVMINHPIINGDHLVCYTAVVCIWHRP